MKPEHLARLRSIQVLLRDVREEIDVILHEQHYWDSLEKNKETHIDDKQDEIDQQESESLTIADLEKDMEKIKITARVTVISDATEFDNSKGGKSKVCNITVADESGAIDIPLFDEELMFKENLKVLQLVDIEAWKVTEYKGKLQLKLGKYGHILPAGQEAL